MAEQTSTIRPSAGRSKSIASMVVTPDIAFGKTTPNAGSAAHGRAAAGEEWLGRLAKDDPGLLDLLLGVLFRYDP